ncbi:MAG: hypothetical protein COT17_00025 [Elusimicrobia bacterium CG08_land_8_20_14_0_20_51_18]|nr:MAG: hypothetical protein COT17_00025 [Elusimicrobia bacterium CG08_land_8_20_14_0_20_51_18]
MGKIKITAAFLFLFSAFACKGDKRDFYYAKAFVMSVPIEITVYDPDKEKGKNIADLLLKEVKRVSDDFSYTEPYSYTSHVNKNAYNKWVKMEEEMYVLLKISRKYYDLTDGAFDVTFAPLWPIWKDAAAAKKLPSKDEIEKAIAKIGHDNIEMDERTRMIRFKKPVEINLGGILRGYSFVRIIDILKKNVSVSSPVQVEIGTNKLCWGEKDWTYTVNSPLDEKKVLGTLKFRQGVVISSSGRSHFVKIEDKLYSHILSIKTGYPIENFSTLVVYVPDMDMDFISSAALATMGREKAFDYISKYKGVCAIWVDGAGNVSTLINEDSSCSWEKPKKYLFF